MVIDAVPRFAPVIFVIVAVSCRTHAIRSRVETRDFASGTRLKAHVWDVGGALVLRDFTDTERGEPCSFLEDSLLHVGPGPTYYCLPLGMARHDAASGPFADEKCSVRVAVPPVDAPATYAIVRPANACSATPEVHRANAPSRASIWMLENGRCTNTGAFGPVQTLGDLVPLDAFVHAAEVVEARGGRIGALLAVASDGARVTLGGHDEARREPVRIDGPTSAPGPFRWVPSRVAFVGAGSTVFSDPLCTSPVATKSGIDAACPLSAALVFEAQCANTTTFHALGPPLTGPTFTRDPTGCNAVTAAAATPPYAVGVPIPNEAFAAATVIDGPGAGVHRRGFAGPGGTDPIQWTDVLDETTGEPCTPIAAVDGTTRCLPSASASIALFADPACTAPAYAEPLTGCDQPLPHFVRDDVTTGARAYEVLGPTPLFDKSSGQCRSFTPVVTSRGLAVREIDVTRFVAAVDRTL